MYQHIRSQKKDHNYRSSRMSHIFSRRLIIYVGLILLAYSVRHLIQTGLFLFEHFFPNEETTDLIRLDIKTWRENTGLLTTQIPRHIHQIWISSTANKTMPKNFEKAANSCIQLHPTYNYTLWTHPKILVWLKKEYSWFLPVYKNYRYDMQRIDAMKYFFLFHFGGIYIDLDVQCHARDLITRMIPKGQTKSEPDIIFHMGGEGISANTDIVAAKRYHPFFKLAINRLRAANRWFYFYHLTIILSAGPTFLYGIYRSYPLKKDIFFIPNDLLWGKLVGGVGGATWYGMDTLVFIFLMENTLLFCFLLIIFVIASFILYKVMKKAC